MVDAVCSAGSDEFGVYQRTWELLVEFLSRELNLPLRVTGSHQRDRSRCRAIEKISAVHKLLF